MNTLYSFPSFLSFSFFQHPIAFCRVGGGLSLQDFSLSIVGATPTIKDNLCICSKLACVWTPKSLPSCVCSAVGRELEGQIEKSLVL